MRVLAGDIGGTKTLLAVAEAGAGGVRVQYRQRYDSRAFPDLAPIIDGFLRAAAREAPGPLDGACLGVAGPVHGARGAQRARITNLPWIVDCAGLGAARRLPAPVLINDFEAVAHGIAALDARDLAVLQDGSPVADAPLAVLGAGTGLGMALAHCCDGRRVVTATEGGHAGYAPADARQHALWRFAQERHGRVSIERLVSGAGLVEIAAFVAAGHGGAGPALERAMAADDPPAALAAAGLARSDPQAAEALDLFVRIYGSVAGDLALLALPRGGLYVAGGIAPKILPCLRAGGFMDAFLDKAPMRELLAAIPVRVVLNPEAGLLGAARVAAGLGG